MDTREKRKKIARLYAMLTNLHIENRKLQTRIANQRQTYRRWHAAVQKALAENENRRQKSHGLAEST